MTLDEYKCVAVSTGHLTENDRDQLHRAVHGPLFPEGPAVGNMIMERDTGWFMKLYGELDANMHGPIWSDQLQRLITWAHYAGYRMIEFDGDAPVIPWLEWEEY